MDDQWDICLDSLKSPSIKSCVFLLVAADEGLRFSVQQNECAEFAVGAVFAVIAESGKFLLRENPVLKRRANEHDS